MKNFIITSGAILLILTIMKYQFMCNEMLRNQKQLKWLAEEAAATACLCYSEESYGNGKLSFDRQRAYESASRIIKLNTDKKIEFEIFFLDGDRESPEVQVRLGAKGIKSQASYEQKVY